MYQSYAITLKMRIVSSIVLASFITATTHHACAMDFDRTNLQRVHPITEMVERKESQSLQSPKQTQDTASDSHSGHSSDAVIAFDDSDRDLSDHNAHIRQTSILVAQPNDSDDAESSRSSEHTDENPTPTSDVTRDFFTFVEQTFQGENNPDVAKRMTHNRIAALALTAALGYSLWAEGKYLYYTGFRALATTPYFYEQFYYKYDRNSNYYYDRLVPALITNAFVLLSVFLYNQHVDFFNYTHPNPYAKTLKQNYGAPLEWGGFGYLVLSSLAVGMMAGGQYLQNAYALKGTEESLPTDYTLLPALLGLSFAINAFNMKTPVIKKMQQRIYRYRHGDQDTDGHPVDVMRDRLMKGINAFEKKITKLPHHTSASVAPELNPDIETQIAPTETIHMIADRFAAPYANGRNLFSEMAGDTFKRPARSRINADHIHELRQQLDTSTTQRIQTTTYQKIIKNKWLLLASLFTIPAAILAGVDFTHSTQFALSGDLSKITDLDTQNQALMQYLILKKYREYFESNPVKWLTECISPDRIDIVSNTTFTADDDYFQGTDMYNTSSWEIKFYSSPKCKGVAPFSPWYAYPRDLDITPENADMWFNLWESGSAYNAGVPIAANNYTALTIHQPQIPTQGKAVTYFGAGLFGLGTYVTSTVGTATMIESLFDPLDTGRIVNTLGTVESTLKAAPIGIATWLSINTMDNQYLMWALVTMTTMGPLLGILPQFKGSYRKAAHNMAFLMGHIPGLKTTAKSIIHDQKYTTVDFLTKVKTVREMIKHMDSDKLYELYQAMNAYK